MTWLENQKPENLKSWLRNMKVPAFAADVDGCLLWCNPEFEELIGYTINELVTMHWIDLAETKFEKDNTIAMNKETSDGRRPGYMARKDYRCKDGPPIKCIEDVLRSPIAGDFECFLVTIQPINNGFGFAVERLEEVHAKFDAFMLAFKQASETPAELKIGLSDVHNAAREHPIIATVCLLLFGVLLFGERVIEIVQLVVGVFQKG